MSTKARTEFRIDRESQTIVFGRRLPGSRERAFDAWTRPEQIRLWWDPSGHPLSACEVDLRPGGRFKFVHQGDAHSPPFEGVYQLVERPTQLVFEALGSLGTVKLSAQGEDTHMQVSIRCSSAEHLEHFLKLGVAEGTRQTLDNLAAQLGASE